MTTADHISDCFGVWGIRRSFRLHNSIHQFRVLGTLAETYQTGRHLSEEKKTTQLLRLYQMVFEIDEKEFLIGKISRFLAE